jgi:hypothetical protein
MRTIIEQKLSPAQQEDFYQRCKKAPGGFTGPVITEIAADFGIKLQHDSANTIRAMLRERHLAEIKANAEFARLFAAAAQHGLGLNDAAAVKLAIKVNDDLDKTGELSLNDKNKYSLLISRLRAGDQRGQMVEVLKRRLELQQFDAASAAIKRAKEIRAIVADKKLDGPQKTERVRKLLFGEQPADFKPVTGTGAAIEPDKAEATK